MSDGKPEVGTIGWIDLTIPNAPEIKDFYSKVVGWKSAPLSMGDYDDYVMSTPETDKAISGVCHARGFNKDLPAHWLIYITVADVEQSAKNCVELGGKILMPVKIMTEYGKYCVIEDPAGAVCALFEPK